MKKKDVVARLYSGLGDVLIPLGFRLAKGQEAFVRKTATGDQRLYVSVQDMVMEFVFALVVGVRIDSVEDICHKFSGAQPEHQGLSVTSITPLDYFSNRKPFEHKVASPEQIDAALQDVIALLKHRVLPFLDGCSDAACLERHVNAEPASGFNIAQLPYGAMTASTLAFLVKNPRFDNLVAGFREAMKLYPETERSKYDSLVSYLSSGDVPPLSVAR